MQRTQTVEGQEAQDMTLYSKLNQDRLGDLRLAMSMRMEVIIYNITKLACAGVWHDNSNSGTILACMHGLYNK